MINVTCAIIRNEENQILVVQRGENTDHPFKWEFPGGKIDPGENDEECIIREINEELSIEIVICGKLHDVEYDYGYKQIRLIPFICDTLDEIPLLTEHLDYKWLAAGDLMSADFSEADVIVAGEYLEDLKEIPSPLKSMSVEDSSSFDDKELQAMINRMMGMKEAEWVAKSAIENPVIFMKLLEYSHSSDNKLAFHSSWILTKVCDKLPKIIYPYLPQMISGLRLLENESTLRSFLRIISLSDLDGIDSHRHGLLADFCFSTLNSGPSAVAVKAYSMEILYKLSVIYPELANELSALIRILLEDGSGGIISRGQMILKKLAVIPVNPKSNQPLF